VFADLGAAVMGTAIVSIALRLDRVVWPSDALMWTAAALWLLMVVSIAELARSDRRRLVARASDAGSLSVVAGTCVLGTRLGLAGSRVPPACLLGVGALAWLALAPRVLRRRRRPVPGAGFLVTVATIGLAVLGASTASAYGSGALGLAAVAALLLGLLLYPVVLASFDLRELTRGCGDHWVAGGALAIAALGAGQLASVARGLDPLRPLRSALQDGGIAIWCAAMLWLVALVAAEVRHPRLGYDVRRWATVFPLGMYGAASIVVGRAAGMQAIAEFGRVWVWIALAAWAAVAAASVRALLDHASAPVERAE
jgi:hypothetical protein